MVLRLLVALFLGPHLDWDDVEPDWEVLPPHVDITPSLAELRLA